MSFNQDLHFYTTSVISLLSCFSLYKSLTLQYKAHKNKKLIKTIQQAPMITPDSLVRNGQKVILLGTVQFNSKDPRNIQIMHKDQKTKKDEQYVIHLKYKESIYSNDNFTEKEQYNFNLKDVSGRANIQINPSFLLMGKYNKKGAVISGFDKIDYSQILDITRWDNKMRKLSFTEKLQVFMLSYFRAAGTLVISDKSRSKALRGLDIGTREVEAGMKIGSTFMALGTLTVDLSGELSMEPNLLFKDTFSVTAKLQDIITGDEKARNFWVLVFTLTCLYVGRRAYNYNKKYSIVEKVQKWWSNQKKQKPAGL